MATLEVLLFGIYNYLYGYIGSFIILVYIIINMATLEVLLFWYI